MSLSHGPHTAIYKLEAWARLAPPWGGPSSQSFCQGRQPSLEERPRPLNKHDREGVKYLPILFSFLDPCPPPLFIAVCHLSQRGCQATAEV